METGDLTEEEIERIGRGLCCVDRPCTDYTCRAVRELRRHRETVAADKERVRSVVRDAVRAALESERESERLYIVRPYQPAMGEIALEAYGHGRACDAAALLGDDLRAVIDAIADRAAEQLAPVMQLSANERSTLKWLRSLLLPGKSEQCRDAIVLIDRIVGDGR